MFNNRSGSGSEIDALTLRVKVQEVGLSLHERLANRPQLSLDDPVRGTFPGECGVKARNKNEQQCVCLVLHDVPPEPGCYVRFIGRRLDQKKGVMWHRAGFSDLLCSGCL
jgi:hypothetical protein